MRMPSSDARKSLAEKVAAFHANAEGGATSFLAERGITQESIDRFQLGFDGKRLTIPYLTPAGPWHVKYRCLQHGPGSPKPDEKCEGHPKYSYDPGSDIHLYNAGTLAHANIAVITEGELDAITCEQIGLPAVAYPGTEMWKANKHWRWVFDSVDEIAVIADGDDVGRKAAAYVCESLRNTISADVKVVVLPDGHDSNSFINTYGETEFLSELEWL